MDGFNADALVAWFKQNPSAIPEQFSMPQGRTSATEPGESTIAREVAATSGSAGEEGMLMKWILAVVMRCSPRPHPLTQLCPLQKK